MQCCSIFPLYQNARLPAPISFAEGATTSSQHARSRRSWTARSKRSSCSVCCTSCCANKAFAQLENGLSVSLPTISSIAVHALEIYTFSYLSIPTVRLMSCRLKCLVNCSRFTTINRTISHKTARSRLPGASNAGQSSVKHRLSGGRVLPIRIGSVPSG